MPRALHGNSSRRTSNLCEQYARGSENHGEEFYSQHFGYSDTIQTDGSSCVQFKRNCVSLAKDRENEDDN